MIGPGRPFDALNNDETASNKLPSYHTHSKLSSSWLDLRVFYMRVSNFVVDDSTPQFLTLNLIPFCPDTLLEVNGSRCGHHSDGVSSVLRRDRMDKKCEEATYVGTDSIRLTNKVKFEVLHKDKLILTGILEMASCNGVVTEPTRVSSQWSMSCESLVTARTSFLKGKQKMGHEIFLPTIEVYLTGCFSGTPVILTKSIQLSNPKKQNKSCTVLEVIPEDETPEYSSTLAKDLEVSTHRSYKLESEEDYYNPYWRGDYIESEDGELLWFNAGVRVGVGIGLGVCLGVGIGVGLMLRTYQVTSRKFRGRLL